MGQIIGTYQTRHLGLKMDDNPTYDSSVGFGFSRGERVMYVCEEDLISARIPPKYRDYCAHLLLDYSVCRYKNMPFLYRCHHEKHAYLNCEHADYVIRMKEFERERRLREREIRVLKQAKESKEEKPSEETKK
ncbi:NADH dehydrogenase [ubiquinone] 1 beta subcomplex subunit 7-like [Manduca sexta]|uniref:NADH dehydrogenase [ubiquinone] 1 beta subcomplex subunit 7-like n=1 Tax=Manduca sexta TaxID=7130 RepID=UPI00188FF5B3|nr:NADH dehydrogenase [ubiquinone] 1 beta subcomplex subunit 7-like [Manduca sexta]